MSSAVAESSGLGSNSQGGNIAPSGLSTWLPWIVIAVLVLGALAYLGKKNK
jgi:hypothetical protein